MISGEPLSRGEECRNQARAEGGALATHLRAGRFEIERERAAGVWFCDETELKAEIPADISCETKGRRPLLYRVSGVQALSKTWWPPASGPSLAVWSVSWLPCSFSFPKIALGALAVAYMQVERQCRAVREAEPMSFGSLDGACGAQERKGRNC
jgi:hypothetical protein